MHVHPLPTPDDILKRMLNTLRKHRKAPAQTRLA
jgi:hypothetical protein